MISGDEEQEALSLCEICVLEEATHVHSADDGGDPIAVCNLCCETMLRLLHGSLSTVEGFTRIESG